MTTNRYILKIYQTHTFVVSSEVMKRDLRNSVGSGCFKFVNSDGITDTAKAVIS